MSRPEDVPESVWADAYATAVQAGCGLAIGATEIIARAIMAERAGWQPAVTYFDRYCQDEADDVENCVCGERQHEDAKAFADAVKRGQS
jgi:hypothetical protein